MERLVTTAQAAQILGLSLQGVHYRINHNQLKSIKKSGKTYVYISDNSKDWEEEKIKEVEQVTTNEIVKVKDEQIELLKRSIKWMKKQYGSEILRLEKNQKRIIGVFNREIELLQSAFNEMRSVYKPELQQKSSSEQNKEEPKESSTNKTTETKTQSNDKNKFISLQDFAIYLKQNNKSEKDIKLIILKAVQNRDHRFIYNKKDKQILILNDNFQDLI